MRFHRPRGLRSHPKVSVVIPCYQYGRFLPTAVESVLAQTEVEVEVVIVDDASPDDSAQVAHALAAKDSRVRVVAHGVNLGHIATYNDGLSQVCGDYVVLLSADDALVTGSLARAVALLQAHPRVGLVYGYSVPFSDEVREVAPRVRSWSTWNGRDWLARMCRRAENPISTPEVVMRREAWDEIGGYDPRVPAAADMLVWFRTAARWDIGRVNCEAQAQYRVHGDNMHLTTYSGMLRDLREQRQVFSILVKDAAAYLEGSQQLELAARRALARRALRLASAERLSPDGAALTEEYRRFAARTLPDELRTWSWRARRAGDSLLESRVVTPVRRVVEHVVWRRWRRYGI